MSSSVAGTTPCRPQRSPFAGVDSLDLRIRVNAAGCAPSADLKLVDVVAVEDMTSEHHLARELLLIKLQMAAEHIEAVDALLRRVGGKVLSPNPSSYIVELTSTEAEIGEFIANVAAFGEIVEVVRSGVLGIARANPRLHIVK